MCVLIVDDHQSLQMLLATYLQDIGYEAVAAENGADALSYLRRTAELPGLILLDIAMPKMTGWEFLHHQQHDPRLASIPVVLMTALGHVDCPECAPNAIAAINKPMDLAELESLLHTYYRYRIGQGADKN